MQRPQPFACCSSQSHVGTPWLLAGQFVRREEKNVFDYYVLARSILHNEEVMRARGFQHQPASAHDIFAGVPVLVAAERCVEQQRNRRHRDEDDRAPIETGRIDLGRRWKCQPNDQEQIVDERNDIREHAHPTHIPPRDVQAISSRGARPEGTGVREGVRGVQRDELARDDGVESDGGAEVDACQGRGDEASDVDRVTRRVRWLGDLESNGKSALDLADSHSGNVFTFASHAEPGRPRSRANAAISREAAALQPVHPAKAMSVMIAVMAWAHLCPACSSG